MRCRLHKTFEVPFASGLVSRKVFHFTFAAATYIFATPITLVFGVPYSHDQFPTFAIGYLC